MTTENKIPQDESKLSPYEWLRLRQAQYREATKEAETRTAECDAEQRRVLAAFKVERTNQVGKLNKVKMDAITKAQEAANAEIAKAQAEAHKIVDAATVAANAKVDAVRQACSKEFSAKSLELAGGYERDHAALTTNQATARAKLVQTWDKAKAALVAQIETLTAQLAAEEAKAQELAAAKAAALVAEASDAQDAQVTA